MIISEQLQETPWDRSVFGFKTYELMSVTHETMRLISRMRGHFTVRVDPLASKELLHKYGFYYCDTLIEPFCSEERLVILLDESIRITQDISQEDVLNICHGAFSHGRFHRDFHIDRASADQRYDNWLAELYRKGSVFGLVFEDDLAGFIAMSDNRMVLHAISQRFQGKGLAKYLWSAACREFFRRGFSELTSSVSASNVVVVNLYASLGFRFRAPKDIYHRMEM